MQNLLECVDITKSFSIRKTRRTVLMGVSLRVSSGEIVTITGKSGSGKSTLLSILAGLDTPDSGMVHLFNTKVVGTADFLLAPLRFEKIGFLFQNHNLIPSWTAFENIEAAIALKKLPPKDVSKKVLTILEEVGLKGCEHNLPSELSAGEQQRVAVARALVNTPLLLFADEAVADVDPTSGRQILDMLLYRVKQYSTAIVFATHGVPPSGFEQRVFELADGKLHTIGQH